MFRTASGGVARPKWFWVVLGATSCIAPALSGTAATPLVTWVTLWSVGVALGASAIRYGLTSVKDAAFERGTLTVDDDRTLSCEGRVLVRAKDLRQGFVVPTEDGTIVRIERRWHPIHLRVRDELEGRELLRALGCGADSTAAEMSAASALFGMSLWRQLVILGVPAAFAIHLLESTGPGAVMTVLTTVLVVAYATMLAYAPTRVRIGTDGILTRWLGRTRFYPFTALVSSTVYCDSYGSKRIHGVRLALRDGTVASIPTGQTDVGLTEAQRLVQRIDEARSAREQGTRISSAGPRDLLVRGQRTLVEWVGALQRMGRGVHDHRHPAVPVDVLIGIVEDASSPALERASAAIAASSSGDSDVKQRVRIAADAVASPQLRAALVRVAETDLAAYEELALALEEIEAVDPRASRRSKG